MATADQIDTDITLELDGEDITPAKFRQGVVAFVGLLEAITTVVCKDERDVDWRVRVKEGSNLIGAIATDGANPAHVREILRMVADGLQEFETEGEAPPTYPDVAVTHVRNLSGVAAKTAEDDRRVGVWVRKRRTEITPAISAAARVSLKGAFSEYGTIEGELSVMNARTIVHFVVYEPVWDRGVRCYVPDRMVDEMKLLWRKRVAVHGMVHYRLDGRPVRIDAEEVEAFPTDADLPTHEDVCGILRETA